MTFNVIALALALPLTQPAQIPPPGKAGKAKITQLEAGAHTAGAKAAEKAKKEGTKKRRNKKRNGKKKRSDARAAKREANRQARRQRALARVTQAKERIRSVKANRTADAHHELSTHLHRMAKLDRIRELAQEAGNKDAEKRATALMEKETQRHDARMKVFEGPPSASTSALSGQDVGTEANRQGESK